MISYLDEEILVSFYYILIQESIFDNLIHVFIYFVSTVTSAINDNADKSYVESQF